MTPIPAVTLIQCQTRSAVTWLGMIHPRRSAGTPKICFTGRSRRCARDRRPARTAAGPQPARAGAAGLYPGRQVLRPSAALPTGTDLPPTYGVHLPRQNLARWVELAAE